MTRTVVDIDDEALARAAEELGTRTKVDTVNAALREVARRAAVRRELERGRSGAYAELATLREQMWR